MAGSLYPGLEQAIWQGQSQGGTDAPPRLHVGAIGARISSPHRLPRQRGISGYVQTQDAWTAWSPIGAVRHEGLDKMQPGGRGQESKSMGLSNDSDAS